MIHSHITHSLPFTHSILSSSAFTQYPTSRVTSPHCANLAVLTSLSSIDHTLHLFLVILLPDRFFLEHRVIFIFLFLHLLLIRSFIFLCVCSRILFLFFLFILRFIANFFFLHILCPHGQSLQDLSAVQQQELILYVLEQIAISFRSLNLSDKDLMISPH